MRATERKRKEVFFELEEGRLLPLANVRFHDVLSLNLHLEFASIDNRLVIFMDTVVGPFFRVRHIYLHFAEFVVGCPGDSSLLLLRLFLPRTLRAFQHRKRKGKGIVGPLAGLSILVLVLLLLHSRVAVLAPKLVNQARALTSRVRYHHLVVHDGSPLRHRHSHRARGRHTGRSLLVLAAEHPLEQVLVLVLRLRRARRLGRQRLLSLNARSLHFSLDFLGSLLLLLLHLGRILLLGVGQIRQLSFPLVLQHVFL
mmetsp:Transcript_39622/g.124541  ORF Transcript_39622/g.124541 Transcript_39622/m.124541 type:complete len:255 (-) Transcript_39622:1688-2452(-)